MYFSAVLQHTKKKANYESYFRSHFRPLWVPYQTLRTQCVKDRKKSEKTFVWLIDVWFLCPWVTVRQRKPDFFLEECNAVCSKVLCVDLHVFFFFLFYIENCKTCSAFITPSFQNSYSDPKANSIFLTWLVQSHGRSLGMSITNTSSKKKKTLLKCFRKPPFLFYIKLSFWTEQSFLFSYFHLILRLVNRWDHCVRFTCKILFPSEHTHKRGTFSSHFNLIKSQDMFEALSWSREKKNDQGYVSTAVGSEVTALPSVNRSAGNRLESSPMILTKQVY